MLLGLGIERQREKSIYTFLEIRPDLRPEQMIAAGSAYRCWATPEELDAMREAQRAYEANLNVIETARAMEMRTLDLLKK